MDALNKYLKKFIFDGLALCVVLLMVAVVLSGCGALKVAPAPSIHYVAAPLVAPPIPEEPVYPMDALSTTSTPGETLKACTASLWLTRGYIQTLQLTLGGLDATTYTNTFQGTQGAIRPN